ncbi:MAG: exo-alpha-sialidase [Thermoguttaceae bacterium]|nr:exo-alpha-sialidase [Thermoguttaceae bacterium]
MKSIVIKSGCIVLAVVLGYLQPQYAPPKFYVEEKVAQTAESAETSYAPRLVDVPTPSVHASTITELPDGRFMLAWFGGSKEGAPDVNIYSCEMDWNGNFSQPKVLLDRQTLQSQTGRYIRKLGNPLLYWQNGRLHFFVVSVSVGGWSGSSINYACSDDRGETWSSFKRLQLSPLFNISALVRCPPVPMTNNCIGLLIYHEFICKYGEFVVLDSHGRIFHKTKGHSDLRTLQPCVVAFNQTKALVALRNGNKNGGAVKAAVTSDAGQTWTPISDLPIENPDSCLALLTTDDGTLLLVGNPKEGRGTLNLWKSRMDDLQNWTLCAALENESECEFSYPTLIKDSAGRVHLIYTWKRKSICHRVLSPELWNAEQVKDTAKSGGKEK